MRKDLTPPCLLAEIDAVRDLASCSASEFLSNLARNSLAEQDARSRTASISASKQGGVKSFLIGALIQISALFVGATGASILIIRPQLPIIIAFLLESVALAILCVNAARGAYLYGIKRFLLTFATSLLVLVILGGLYRF